MADVLDEDRPPLAPERTLDKYRHAFNAGHPLAAAGIAFDDGGIDLAFLQH